MTLILLILLGAAQAPEVGPHDERVMTTVRAAVTPALPYPPSDEEGVLPKDVPIRKVQAELRKAGIPLPKLVDELARLALKSQ